MSNPERPAVQERVRQLLADARHDESVPTEVAERLDRVLAELRSSRPNTGSGTDVRPARRRRPGRRLVLAAAAVGVLGVVGTQIELPGGSGTDTAAETTGRESAADAADADAAADADGADGAGSGAEAPAPPPASDLDELHASRAPYAADARTARPLRLTSASFDRVVRRFVRQETAARGYLSKHLYRLGSAAVGCGTAEWGRGRRVPASYDGAPATLIFRPEQRDGSHLVDLYLCGASAPIRSTAVLLD